MRGATKNVPIARTGTMISIHTPHAGSDDITIVVTEQADAISIHTPHAGSDVPQS